MNLDLYRQLDGTVGDTVSLRAPAPARNQTARVPQNTVSNSILKRNTVQHGTLELLRPELHPHDALRQLQDRLPVSAHEQ